MRVLLRILHQVQVNRLLHLVGPLLVRLGFDFLLDELGVLLLGGLLGRDHL